MVRQEKSTFVDKRTGWYRETTFYEPNLKREVWYDKDGNLKSDKYHVVYGKKELKTRRVFTNLDEAKEYNLICRENLNRYRLNNLVSVQRTNERQKVILEYPETLLKVIGIEDMDYINYYDYIIPHFNENFKKIIEKNVLTQKEIDALMFRYKDGLTLDETGKYLGGITRERVRQIESKAIRKLMHPSLKNTLINDNRYELIDAQERQKMYDEIKEKMTYEIALEIVKQHNPNFYNPLGERARIEDLDLSVRSYNCLKRFGFNYIDELINLINKNIENNKWVGEFMKIRNLGKKSFREVINKLNDIYDMGLSV